MPLKYASKRFRYKVMNSIQEFFGTVIFTPLTREIQLCNTLQNQFSIPAAPSLLSFLDHFDQAQRQTLQDFFDNTPSPGETSSAHLSYEKPTENDLPKTIDLRFVGSLSRSQVIIHVTGLEMQSSTAEVDTLHKEIALFKTTFNGMADPVFIKDCEHKWLFLNDAMCTLMGVQREDFIGKSDFDFFPKEEAENFWKKDNEVFLSDHPVEVEENFTDAEDALHTILTKKVKSILPDGNPILIGIIRDISKRKLAETELAKDKNIAQTENEMKDRFIMKVSHELKTPINGICGMATLLQEAIHSTREQDIINTIQESGMHLLSIINSILDFSSTFESSDSPTPQPEVFATRKETFEILPLDIRAAMKEISSEIKTTFSDHNNRYQLEISDDVPQMISTEKSLFLKAIYHLLENHFKFCNASDILCSISSEGANQDGEQDEGNLLIHIKDNGPGISARDLPFIFSPFYQADDSSTRTNTGCGMGLALAKKNLNLIGGSVTAQSTPGEGTEFKITLPFKVNWSITNNSTDKQENLRIFNTQAESSSGDINLKEKFSKENKSKFALDYPLSLSTLR